MERTLSASTVVPILKLMFCVFIVLFFPPPRPTPSRPVPSVGEGYTKGAVTQNVGEKGVNSVLDYVSSSNDWDLLKGFYEQTLDTLR